MNWFDKAWRIDESAEARGWRTARSGVRGRTTLAALGCVLVLAAAGSLALSRRAAAQNSTATKAVEFGPVGMVQPGNDGVNYLVVKAHYPAAPNPATPFRVEAATNYRNVTLDIPASSSDVIHEVEALFQYDLNGVMRLWLVDLASGAYSSSGPIGSQADAYDVVTRIRPAIRQNGTAAYPLSAVDSADVDSASTTEDGYDEWYTYTFEVEPTPAGGLGG